MYKYVLLMAMGCASWGAEVKDQSNDKDKPVNTVCPIDGVKVDLKVAPLKCKTVDGKSVKLGFCSERCRNKGIELEKARPGCLTDEASDGQKPSERDKQP